MSLFDKTQGSTLFRNEDALDPEWVPKILPFREGQQKHIARCIQPLLQNRNGKNLFLWGAPGIGKTAAVRWVLRDLEDTTEEVIGVYVNCWQKNTTYKIFLEICSQFGYRFTQNKNTDDLFAIIRNYANKKPTVFVFDEVDKAEDFDFLYNIQNDIFKKTVIILTNYKDWLLNLEERLMSRLGLEAIDFKPYNNEEIKEILRQRLDFAFVPTAWAPDAFTTLTSEISQRGDMRMGLRLLRESGMLAELEGSKRITPEHVEQAIDKLREVTVKKKEDLDEIAQEVLNVVKNNSGKRIGELYDEYKNKGGEATYKTFQRKIEKLEKGKFINTDKVIGGKDGTTTIVKYGQTDLTEFP